MVRMSVEVEMAIVHHYDTLAGQVEEVDFDSAITEDEIELGALRE